MEENLKESYETLKEEHGTLKEGHVELVSIVDKMGQLIRGLIDTMQEQKKHREKIVAERLKNHYQEIEEILSRVWKIKY